MTATLDPNEEHSHEETLDVDEPTEMLPPPVEWVERHLPTDDADIPGDSEVDPVGIEAEEEEEQG